MTQGIFFGPVTRALFFNFELTLAEKSQKFERKFKLTH